MAGSGHLPGSAGTELRLRWEEPTISTAGATQDKRLYYRAKRLMDLAITALALIALIPLLGLIALAIKLDSRGPVIFRQERMGWDWRKRRLRPFVMLKFRTMYHNCDQTVHREFVQKWAKESNGQRGSNGHVKSIELASDRRVTKAGRWLRKTSLDELPQLWNVIKGDMSLVGPRPVPLYEAELYQPWQKLRLEATPGITGLWQVTARGQVCLDDWVRLDIEYITRQSLGLDLQILVRTIPAVIIGRGAV
jgi:lipopolysaccharide/colanic/teichoic acid biosynthesis glycosyltransferase